MEALKTLHNLPPTDLPARVSSPTPLHCSLALPIMISCRNLSGRYSSTWAGSVETKPSQYLGKTGTESPCRTGLLTYGAFIRCGNYFEQHSKVWLWEGKKKSVFIATQSKMIAPNVQNRIESVLDF